MKRVVTVLKNQRVLVFTILLVAVMSIVNRSFMKPNNVYAILISLPAYGMCALGLGVSLICGELNISMGSIMAFTGVTFALMTRNGLSFVPALLVVLVMGAAWGAIGGFFVAVMKIDSFVVTLSMMTLIRGVALLLSNQQPIVIANETMKALGVAKLGTIPLMAVFFIAFVVLTEYILRQTVFGRNLYAIGANAEIAKSVGTNISFHKIMVFVIFSIYASVGGLFLAARMSTGSPVAGSDAPLSVIPMVILGGTALSGGKGGALKTLLGVFLLQTVFNCMSLYGITANVQLLVKGIIVLGIVVWDKYSMNRLKKV